MKKPLALIGLIVFAALAAISFLTLQQPTDYTVLQSTTIAKPQSEIYPVISNLEEWKTWSPWFERDPQMKISYGEIKSGKGASSRWESQAEGKGQQTITDVIENESINIKLEFQEPMQGEAFVSFNLKALDNASTEVSWKMEAKNNSFIEKFFFLIMDVKTLINTDFKKGLDNLKNKMEQ